MPIKILQDGDLFQATVTPPHSRVEWSTPMPMWARTLDRQLFDLGCHQTDIGDAFYEADPDWIQRTDED